MAGKTEKKPSPSDLELLEAIYNRYFDEFASYTEDEPSRSSKIYVPIDIEVIAEELNVDSDLVFGRLYYHLEHKYGYDDDDANHAHTPFFAMRVGRDAHCINFPYLGAVLATLRDENRKFRIATTTAVVSLVIAIASFLMSLLS